ncbi:Pyruvate/Phosphoenolpyruvate kinase-like domain-containing protein [Bisporella sp. PMI_857]|nr:Pyruvate/Phosphoenolpyruvate kinase-like domain-containing protein [Bisporella sp. PMI_857]
MALPYLEQTGLHAKAQFQAALLIYPGNFKTALRQAATDPKRALFAAYVILSTYMTTVHAHYNRPSAVQAAQHHPVAVHAPKHDKTALSMALEAGAFSIIIHHCETTEEIRAFAKAAYYHKQSSSQRSHNASLYWNALFNMISSNRHNTLIPQIETAKGIKTLDEIPAVEVGALIFRPIDYMADAGIPLSMNKESHPDLVAAIGKFAAAGQRHGKPFFGSAMTPEMIPILIKQGYRVICVDFDTAGLARFFKSGPGNAKELAQKVD